MVTEGGAEVDVHPMVVAGAVTVTMAVALLLVSAWLMATTLWVPGEVPAAYKPLVEIVPTLALPPATPSTDQVTAVSVAFVTVAVNCCV